MNRHMEFFGNNFYVRRISNDDDEKSLMKFSSDFAQRQPMDYLIMTLCPNFQKGSKTKDILDELKKTYDLYFFVLRKSYLGDKIISDEERNELEKYGKKVDGIEQKEEADIRSARFSEFIKQYI